MEPRRRTGVGGWLVAALALLSATTAGCGAPADDHAGESSDDIDSSPRILALGDSISFGWDPLVETDLTKVKPVNYRGFAEIVAERLGYAIDNAACPGESSGSFSDTTVEDNGCRKNRASYGHVVNRETYGVHLNWNTYASRNVATQSDFVDLYLKDSIAKHAPPKMVTITIGGNDLLLMRAHCQDKPVPRVCEAALLPSCTAKYHKNLALIFDRVAQTGYAGPFVILNTYSTDYSKFTNTVALRLYNGEFLDAVKDARSRHPKLDIVVVDAHSVFKGVADLYGGKICDSGLLIPLPSGECDEHPTPEGHALLASALIDAVEAQARGAR
jgi:lysophospholipase L1-like esterase